MQKNVGSVVNVRGNGIKRPNIITFGSPCQDFSLAGLRKGLGGKKSSLIQEAIRIIREWRPDVFVWENVKGTFSSNDGADFWAILQAFTDIGGYRLEWQLLDTAWFLPQSRERIYLVGRLATSGGDLGEVFPISGKSRKAFELRKRRGGDIDFISVGDYREDEGFRWRKDGLCPTIQARARQDGSGQPLVKVAKIGRSEKAKEIRREYNRNGRDYSPFSEKVVSFEESGVMNTITCSTQKDNLIQIVDETGERIRRLTEIECERLQGFPDNWTKYGLYPGKGGELVKKLVSPTQRYKMIGNAVTVDIPEEIGIKIMD